MKKISILFYTCFCFVFSCIIANADYVFDGEDFLIVEEGSRVCVSGTYYYGAAVYDYDVNGEFMYIGKLSAGSDNCFSVEINDSSIVLGSDTGKFVVYNRTYSYGGPIVVPYYEPEVSLTCDNSNLKYGENTVCTLSYETKDVITSVNYSAIVSSKPNCIVDVKFPFETETFNVVNYVSKIGGDIKFENSEFIINNASDQCVSNAKNDIMEITLTPANKEVTGEKIEVNLPQIEATDFLSTNIHSTSTNLSVVPGEKPKDEINNPNTIDTQNVILLLLVIVGSVFLMVLSTKKLNFYKIY